MQKSKTQIGFLGLVEKYVRKFVTIYYFIRSIAIKFDIFETIKCIRNICWQTKDWSDG